MMYLNYDEYSVMGGTLEETAFNRFVDRANGIIDSSTHGRVEAMSEVPHCVKALCRDLTDYLAAHDMNVVQVTSRSQGAGSVSQSESYLTADAATEGNDIDAMIVDYLLNEVDDNGTPLLYRGGTA